MKKLLIAFVAVTLLVVPAMGQAQTPRPGGTLNFVAPYDGDLYGLDPHKCTRIQEFLVLMNIYRALYRWDPDKGVPVLDLATKVEVSPDGLTYTYQLHKNVKFHNGRADERRRHHLLLQPHRRPQDQEPLDAFRADHQGRRRRDRRQGARRSAGSRRSMTSRSR